MLLRESENHQLEASMREFMSIFTILPHQVSGGVLTEADLLGMGSFGKVYRALFDEELVAVKLLKSSITIDKKFKHAFQLEVKQMRTLRHGNILAYVGAGEWSDGRLFLVTEYCQLGTLANVLLNSSLPIPWSRILRFATQIAQGMQFLHSKHLAHRDLKSPNVLVTDSWTCKIADFGSLKNILNDSSSEVIHSGSNSKRRFTIAGTMEWMAPEAQNRPDLLTFRGDVYSFGIIMWEIVARQSPFVEEDFGINGRELRQNISNGGRPKLTLIPDERRNDAYEACMQACWAQVGNSASRVL